MAKEAQKIDADEPADAEVAAGFRTERVDTVMRLTQELVQPWHFRLHKSRL